MESAPNSTRSLQELFDAAKEGNYQYDGNAFQIYRDGSRLEIYSSRKMHVEGNLIDNWLMASSLKELVCKGNESYHPSDRELLDQFLQLLGL